MTFFYKPISKFILYLLLAIAFFSTSHQVYGANKLTEKAQHITVTDASPLTIAINKTSFPYHAIDKQGNVIGLMPDLWRLWAKKQNIEIKFVVLDWLATLDQVTTGEVDIHGGLTITDSRKKDFLFSPPLLSIYSHVYINQSLKYIHTLADLKPYSVGVVKGSSHVEYFKENNPELSLKIFQNRHDLYKAALNNEVFIFIGLEKLADDFDGYKELNKRFPVHKRLRIEQSKYGVAVAKNKRDLLNYVNQGFAKISREEQSFIERKWFALDKQKDSLMVSFPVGYPPYVDVSPSGKPQGLLIDVWKKWSKHVGIPIEFVSKDLIEGLQLVKNKRVDASLLFPTNKAIPVNASFAKPIYEAVGQVFINEKIKAANNHKFHSLDELSTKLSQHTFGIWEKSTLKTQLLLQYPRLNLRHYNSIASMLNAVENNEISGIVGFTDLIRAKLVEANLQTLLYSLETPRFKTLLAPVIHSDNTKLMNIINQGFDELDLKELSHLERKWLAASQGELYYNKKGKRSLLTEPEKAYIKSSGAFKLGIVRNFSPMEFIDDKNRFAGINADFIDLISERTGLQFTPIIFDTWNDLYNSLLTNKVDLVGSISKTEERDKLLLFSESYWQLPWGVIHHQSVGRKITIEEFYDKKIAIVKGTYLIDFIMENYPGIKFKIVESRDIAISELQNHTVDGFMTSMDSASYLLRQEKNINLMMSIIEGVNTNKSYFGFSANHNQLQTIMNKGLLSISAKEKQKIYDEWLTIEIKTGLDRAVVWYNAFKFGGVVLVIIFIILWWNRRLKKEIKYRHALERKMKHMATHDELTGLANRVLLQDRLDTAIEFHQRQSLKLAVLFIDLDGFKSVNDTFGHDVGDELLKQVAVRLKGCVRSSDTVVRFGGDEFVLLLTGLNSPDEASKVAEKVLNVIKHDFKLSKTDAHIGCSVGIAMYPNDGNNTRDLIKTADTLMYQVKASGKNNFMFSEEQQSVS